MNRRNFIRAGASGVLAPALLPRIVSANPHAAGWTMSEAWYPIERLISSQQKRVHEDRTLAWAREVSGSMELFFDVPETRDGRRGMHQTIYSAPVTSETDANPSTGHISIMAAERSWYAARKVFKERFISFAGGTVQPEPDFHEYDRLAVEHVVRDAPPANGRQLIWNLSRRYFDLPNDPYTRWLSVAGRKFEEAQLNNQKPGGLGVSIGMTPGKDGIVIQALNKGAPAYGKLERGDIIRAIDGAAVSELDGMEGAMIRITGDLNTKVRLQVERNGGKLDVEIVRGSYRAPMVSPPEIVGTAFAHIKVSGFMNGVGSKVRSAIGKATTALRADQRMLRGIILDVRGNPGGFLEEQRVVSNLFVASGELFRIQKKTHTNHFTANPSAAAFTKQPVVVLTDEHSASASEMLAGTLKGRRRATVIGVKTFGKGIGQELINLEDQTRLRLTEFGIILPGDVGIYHEHGIEPDIVIPRDQMTAWRNGGEDVALQAAGKYLESI